MAKVTNIITGERLMTSQNALRHFVIKGRKALKENDYEKMHKVWEESLKVLAISDINPDLCGNCLEDDLGYCGLRRENIPEKDKFIRYCFPSYLKAMEKETKW